MANDFTFSITTTRFDEDYSPTDSSRITTNFANLARGEHRQQNLRNALTMIDRRFNALAHWDNPNRDRYTLELDIVSVALEFTAEGDDRAFPLLEVLDIQIVDRHTGRRHHGIVGNNFSSYVRGYDFSVLLPAARDASNGPRPARLPRSARQTVRALPRLPGVSGALRDAARHTASACRRAARTLAPRTTTRCSASSIGRTTSR